MEIFFYWLISSIIISLISLIWIVVFYFLSKQNFEKQLIYFLSFSSWAFVWNVFLHIFPEFIEKFWYDEFTWFYIIWWILWFFVLEKYLNWNHCHHIPTKNHPHSFWIMSLLWDFIHNFIDWITLMMAYSLNITLWITTTIAIIAHEIPQEISDFWTLLYAKFTKKSAILLNLFVSISSIIWVIVWFYFYSNFENIEKVLLPIAWWTMIYIALSDFIPKLHEKKKLFESISIITIFILWILTIYFVWEMFHH